ncbi:unnamed protein product [Linum trigynum]|uniref:Uncharacterized protein n=1 Tax=Linum trigynum TaxID=586398 RepID=A0AAV2EEP9_9ROSI
MQRSSPRRQVLLAEVGGRSSLGFGEEKRKRGLGAGGGGLNRSRGERSGAMGYVERRIESGRSRVGGRGWLRVGIGKIQVRV